MTCDTSVLPILQGKTLIRVYRWESLPIIYKAITAITKAAPARVTAAAHGAPNGWRVAIVSVLGMREINARSTTLRDSDYNKATVVDANTIDINAINSAEYTTYTSGGYVRYNTPVSLTGYTARMTIKDRVGGTVLDTFTSAAGDIVLDTAASTVTLTIPAADTAAYTWLEGVYDFEMVSSGGQVTRLAHGAVTVEQEVTT